MAETRKPVVLDVPDKPAASPETAPPLPDILPPGEEAAMQRMARLAARRRGGWLGRFFWASFVGLIGLMLSVAAWDFVTGLIDRNLWLGRAALALSFALILTAILYALRELAAISRLKRIDRLRESSKAADTPEQAAAASNAIDQFYRTRPDMEWPRARLAEHRNEVLDGTDILTLTERELITPLDELARAEVQAAARQVAGATALLPLALVDVLVALSANLRMIRRVAEVYGGRSGLFGSMRLFRAVAVHLVATGAIAVGDDMLEPIIGGGLLSKLSRRFGEGVVNGALTARVGIAAMEVCRPMPFEAIERPKAAKLLRQSLTGLFEKS